MTVDNPESSLKKYGGSEYPIVCNPFQNFSTKYVGFPFSL